MPKINKSTGPTYSGAASVSGGGPPPSAPLATDFERADGTFQPVLTITYPSGASSGYVWTADGQGKGSWQAAPGSSGGINLTWVSVQTSNYAASANQIVPVDTTSNPVTVTLPNAPPADTVMVVKMVTQGGTNTVTVACAGSDVFNKAGGGTTGTLSLPSQGMFLQYNGAGIWTVIADDLPLTQLKTVFAQVANNLSDLASASTARTNLGLGSAAVAAIDGTAGDIAALAASASAGSTGKVADAGHVHPNTGTLPAVLTTLGDIAYENATPAPARLAGNTTGTKNFLTQTGTGVVSAAPAWGTIAAGDLPTGTTGAKGALQLDGTAADILPDGTQAAGSNGKAADSGHVHPETAGWIPADAGFLAWNFDPILGTTGSAPANNTITLLRINVREAMTVTNVLVWITATGSGLTTNQNFVGLYNSSGTLVGTSADQTAAWGSTGLKTAALVSGPFALSAGFCWVAILPNESAGTVPSFLRAASGTSNSEMSIGLTVSTARFATNTTGTSLPSSITPASNTFTSQPFWAALS